MQIPELLFGEVDGVSQEDFGQESKEKAQLRGNIEA